MAKRWLRDDLPVLGLYLALTLGLTYPLITNFSTHVPGTNVDEYTFLWNIWWFKHAIFDLGIDPFTTTFTFYPLGASLAFYTLAILNDIVGPAHSPRPSASWRPATWCWCLSFTLSGYGAYLLVRSCWRRPASMAVRRRPGRFWAAWSTLSLPAASSTPAWATTTSSAPNGSLSMRSSS